MPHTHTHARNKAIMSAEKKKNRNKTNSLKADKTTTSNAICRKQNAQYASFSISTRIYLPVRRLSPLRDEQVCMHCCECENVCMCEHVHLLSNRKRECLGKEARSGNLNNTCVQLLATNSVFSVCQQTLTAKYGDLLMVRKNKTDCKTSQLHDHLCVY